MPLVYKRMEGYWNLNDKNPWEIYRPTLDAAMAGTIAGTMADVQHGAMK